LRYGRIRAEIERSVVFHPPYNAYAGVWGSDIQLKERVVGIILEVHIIPRPVFLYEISLEDQCLSFGGSYDVFDFLRIPDYARQLA
jgi:hypothetical protein